MELGNIYDIKEVDEFSTITREESALLDEKYVSTNRTFASKHKIRRSSSKSPPSKVSVTYCSFYVIRNLNVSERVRALCA